MEMTETDMEMTRSDMEMTGWARQRKRRQYERCELAEACVEMATVVDER